MQITLQTKRGRAAGMRRMSSSSSARIINLVENAKKFTLLGSCAACAGRTASVLVQTARGIEPECSESLDRFYRANQKGTDMFLFRPGLPGSNVVELIAEVCWKCPSCWDTFFGSVPIVQ